MSEALSAQLTSIRLDENAADPTYDVHFKVEGALHMVRLVVSGGAHRVLPSAALVPAMQAFMRPPNDNEEEQNLRQLGQLVDGLMSRLVNSGLLLGWEALLTTGLVPSEGPASVGSTPDGGVCFEGSRMTIISPTVVPGLVMSLARDRLGSASSEGVEKYLELNGLPFTSVPK